MTAPGAAALSVSGCLRSLFFLLVRNQRIRYFGTQRAPKRGLGRAPGDHLAPVAPPPNPETREEGRRLLAVRVGGRRGVGRSDSSGDGGWFRAGLLGWPSFHSVPWRGKPSSLPLLFSLLSASVGRSGPAAFRSPRASAC